MAVLLKWKEPQAVSDYEFRHEVTPEIKNLFRLFCKWSFLIGGPGLVAFWLWLPEGLYPTLFKLMGASLFLPLLLCTQFWIESRLGTQCSIDNKGVFKASTTSGKRTNWKQIESYCFVDYPHAENVRCLELTGRSGEQHFNRKLHFSTSEVSEEEIQSLLHEHLSLHRLT